MDEEPGWVSLHPREVPFVSAGNWGQMHPSGWVMLEEKVVPWGHCSTHEVLDCVCPVPPLLHGSVLEVLCMWGTDT